MILKYYQVWSCTHDNNHNSEECIMSIIISVYIGNNISTTYHTGVTNYKQVSTLQGGAYSLYTQALPLAK